MANDAAEVGSLPLPEYFETVHAPTFMIGASPKTLREYRTTLRYWRRLVGEPALAAITRPMLAQFMAGLQAPPKPASGLLQTFLAGLEPEQTEKGLSAATINKHRRQLLTIIYKAGPPGPRNREALGILRDIPWMKPVKQWKHLPRDVPDDILDRIYRGAEAADHPRLPGIAAPAWWRALFVLAVTIAFRRNALISLRWEWIDWGTSSIILPAEYDKTGQDRQKPLCDEAKQHLLQIQMPSEPLIFPWPGGWRHGESTFYRTWHAIQKAGGVVHPIKLHDLKRACLTRAAAAGASISAIRFLGDHSSIATSQAYINASQEARQVVGRMHLPASFSARD